MQEDHLETVDSSLANACPGSCISRFNKFGESELGFLQNHRCRPCKFGRYCLFASYTGLFGRESGLMDGLVFELEMAHGLLLDSS